MKLLFAFLILYVTTFSQTAIEGKIIYTMAGSPIKDGVILINNGKIEAVGKKENISIPDSYKKYSAEVVTPGLIDARTVVGLSGIYNYAHDQDQLEKSDPIQPELRAIDAYNHLEPLVEWFLSFGITTIHTGHAPGALASGQTMVVKTFGSSLSDMILDSSAAVVFTLGPSVASNYKNPGTRAKGAAMLRSIFYKAIDYKKGKLNKDESKRPAKDLKLETLSKVLEGEIKAVFTVNTTTEILTALRLAKEFNFKIILDGCAEAYKVIDEIKTSGVEIILHPTMIRTYGETKNASFETASILNNNGIIFSLQSGYESYVPKTRVVLFEAAIAAANGLQFEEALASITINPARLFGIDNRVGSIEVGKDADIVLFDGDPFEYTTHICKVFVNGVLADDKCK